MAEWLGLTEADVAALRILDQLDAVVQRPLVDIVPVRPAPAPILDAEGAVVDPNRDGYYPTTAQRTRPVGLRIGGLTPPEIALSIVAELTALRRGADLSQPLSDWSGSETVCLIG